MFTIAEYGAADGGTSMCLMRNCIGNVLNHPTTVDPRDCSYNNGAFPSDIGGFPSDIGIFLQLDPLGVFGAVI